MEEINNTPMNVSEETSKWLSDLEMDEYNLFPEECNLNFLDADEEEFLPQEQTQQQCLSSESNSTTFTNSFTDETNFDSFDFDFEIERPTMELNTIFSDNSIIETISPKLSPSSSNSSLHSQILSFDNLPNSPATNTPQFCGLTPTLISKSKQNKTVLVSPPQIRNIHVSTQNPIGLSKNQNFATKTSQTKRSRANADDHIMAERKRREKLSQSFIALAALVPNLKKMDKASVLAESIIYVKELKERLEVLEEQNKKTKVESVVVLKKPDHSIDDDDDDDDNSSCDESIEGATDSSVQVQARVSGKEMLIRIHCEKHKGILVKVMAEIQSFQLFAVNSSVLPFGDSIDITIIAEVKDNLFGKVVMDNLYLP
ncbi:basic helix loop helix (bHLH) DNA-binding family protein [Medicago truncatula]|uniref:Basic helix loop helix (BHLH) DNA-binding family protein n=1 Tax=Medicago truncatula TaxID=3880 RepID=A0A072TRV6_MEDTR|nr:basic helix loop helix (bHLH) DNA-binding family protein [Medicago truncatula]